MLLAHFEIDAVESDGRPVIVGGGVIGCEYASIFCALGIKVDLVNSRPQLLDFLDAPFTFINGILARHYGIPGISGEEFQRVALEMIKAQGGIFGWVSNSIDVLNVMTTEPAKRQATGG